MLWREKLKSLFNKFTYIKQERGAIFVLTALMLPVLFGFLGLGYDVGNLYMHKARLQHAADAASLAGARAFVNETIEKTKQLEDSYKTNNNATTIPQDEKSKIIDDVKILAKTAAKMAAVNNTNQNMINLPNRQYSSTYSLITDTTKQQYFKAYMEETVQLYFLPVVLKKYEQNVAVEAISTIIKQKSGNQKPDKPKPDPTDANSLYMVKSAFFMDGDGFYNMDSTPSYQKEGHHPTWDGHFDGDLRYTGDTVSFNFGNQGKDNYDDSQFDRVFNSKALALLNTVIPLRSLQGKGIANIEQSTEFNNFINELKKNPDYFDKTSNSLTTNGSAFINEMKQRLPTEDGYWHAYNYFYETLKDNPYYYTSFRHIDYDMDSFGEAMDALFKEKQELNLSASDKAGIMKYTDDIALWNAKYPSYVAAHNNWINSNPYFGKLDKEMQEIHTLLKSYRDTYKKDGSQAAFSAWRQTGKPYMTEEKFRNLVIDAYTLDWYDGSSWGWSQYYNDITMYNVPEPQIADYVKDDKGNALDHYPEITDAKYNISSNNINISLKRLKTYYGEYVGPTKNSWNSSELYAYAAEKSYFYYNNATNFELIIDDGFTVNESIKRDDPFYLYIGDDVYDIIKISLNTDLNRPLVVCYKGNKNPKIQIELNGHIFRGVIYTPNSYSNPGTYGSGITGDDHVHMNLSGGTFEGTWMAGALTLKQASCGNTYVDYELEESLEKAWPGYSEEDDDDDNDDDDNDDDDVNQNRKKVIKLVKMVENVESEEFIE